MRLMFSDARMLCVLQYVEWMEQIPPELGVRSWRRREPSHEWCVRDALAQTCGEPVVPGAACPPYSVSPSRRMPLGREERFRVSSRGPDRKCRAAPDFCTSRCRATGK